MRNSQLSIGLGAILVTSLAAGSALAQCSFDKPATARKMQVEFVAAYPECTVPNATNGNASMDTCTPPAPETGYWQWGAKGRIQLKLSGASKTDVVNPVLNPPGTGDVEISVKLQDILQSDGITPVEEGGANLQITTRVTCDEPTNGDMTAEDFVAEFPFAVSKGKGTVKTSANVAVNGAGIPGAPPCCNIEVTRIAIEAPNGDPFARPGFLIPNL